MVIGVEGELPPLCVRCGYDLRGLSAAGVCPECAAPVEWALDGRMLRSGGAGLARRLERGAAAVVVSVVMELGALGGGAVLVARNGAGITGRAFVIVVCTLLGMLAGGVVLRLVGWWMLTAPDRRWAGRAGDSRARRIVRGALVADVVAVLGLAGLATAHWDVDAAIAIVPLIGLSHTAAWAVQFFASMLYLRWLSRRIPSETLGQRAGRMMWAGPLLMTVGWLVGGIGPVAAMILYAALLVQARSEVRGVRMRVLGAGGAPAAPVVRSRLAG